jgi:transposase
MTHEVSHIRRVVFVGMDVHRQTYKVHAIDGDLEKKWSCEAEPEVVITTLLKHFPDCEITTVYEAGFSGFTLHRRLLAAGINSLVVNPAAILADRSSRSKTDAVDARNMAVQLKAGLLADKVITVPSEEEEIGRVAQRMRMSLLRKSVSIRVQLRMRLHYFGYFPRKHRGTLTLSQAKEMVAAVPDEHLRMLLGILLSLWEVFDSKLKELDKVIKEEAANDPLVPIYQSMPGIGRLTSRVLSSELGDMSRFSSGKKVASYAGMVCTEKSSGESRKLGRISKRGKPHIRNMLVEAGWVAKNTNADFKALYNKLAHRMGSKKAIVAVARRMLLMLRAMLKQRVYFSPELLRATLEPS